MGEPDRALSTALLAGIAAVSLIVRRHGKF